MNIPTSRIKVEAEDPAFLSPRRGRLSGGEVDVARGRFESALLDLFNKDDISESENGSDSDQKDRTMQDTIDVGVPNPRNNAILPTRPVRKRRRKETELRDGGFHHTFVMRMFDRSVDLAQFEESSPLYPICRAWMLNQPRNSDLSVKQEPGSPYHNDNFEENDKDKVEEGEDHLPKVTALPPPDSWPENDESLSHDPRIPKPLPCNAKKLNHISEEFHIAPALLLTQHLHRWRTIRNQWKAVGQTADARYHKSYTLLKAMFEREGEKTDLWNSVDERKVEETSES